MSYDTSVAYLHSEIDGLRDRIAELEAENRYLRGLVASVSRDTTGRDWGAGFCINCDFCPWCREEDVCGHLDDCPAFTPDGKVRTVAP